MEPELSIPVIWSENGGAPSAGRLDVFADHLHLDGGSRDSRELRDLAYDEVGAARIGRENGDRINGRVALVLELADGGTFSFAAFDRPGTLVEVLQRIESRI